MNKQEDTVASLHFSLFFYLYLCLRIEKSSSQFFVLTSVSKKKKKKTKPNPAKEIEEAEEEGEKKDYDKNKKTPGWRVASGKYADRIYLERFCLRGRRNLSQHIFILERAYSQLVGS